MDKYKSADIKPFSFSEIDAQHVVKGSNFKPFEFETLDGEKVKSAVASEEDIRRERNFAAKNNFKIDSIVSDSRGLARQEQSDLEQRIQTEVKRRVDQVTQEAYREGLERGRAEGQRAALGDFEKELAHRVEEFEQIIAQVKAQSDKVIEKNHAEIYEFIKRFTKWIVLKEINEKVYLETLLEKLILELNARKNLIVKVGKANFAQMPEIIQVVESRLGQLQNVRIEIVPELNHPGIILEGENGLIDGSLEGVFQNIDKIFEQLKAPEA